MDFDDCYENGDEFLTDGHGFIGEHNWKAGIETKVHCDFGVSHSLVTTGALKGTELLKQVEPAEKILSVGCSDDVARWLRTENPKCSGSLNANMRVVPYSDTWELRPDTELVRRLTLLPNIKFLVVESDEPAIVVGVMETQQLARRRDEAFEFAEADEDQEAEVELRLQEMLEDARRAGMSSSGVEKAQHLV